MDRLVLSVPEMAKELGISKPKAYELTHDPGFPIIRVGKRILIPFDALQDWIRAMTTTRPNNV